MTKKIIFYLSITFIIFINVILDINVNNYIKIINECFNKNIVLTDFYYMLISFVIGFISILIVVCLKLIMFYKKDEIKGIKLKDEDGTFGTANWLNDYEINQILGKNDVPGIILGKRNNEIIKLPFNSFFNKNIAVFGNSRQYENNSDFCLQIYLNY